MHYLYAVRVASTVLLLVLFQYEVDTSWVERGTELFFLDVGTRETQDRVSDLVPRN